MTSVRETVHEQLSRILGAVTILSPTSFSFAGLTLPAVPQAPWPRAVKPAQNPLVAALQDCLYRHCFCAPFRGSVSGQPQAGVAQDDMSSALSAANRSEARREPGWQILRVQPSGQILAQRFGLTRAFWPGDYVTHDGPGMGPRVGAGVTVFFPKESLTLQPGFYFAFGETVTEPSDQYGLIRFYWNIDHQGAGKLIELCTRELNRFLVPFRIKCLTNRSQYSRLDAAVLYLNKRYYRIARELLSGMLENLAPFLGPETPLFTKRLAPGLALAEDPGNGESFGTDRCRIVAEAIWSGYQRGEQSADERLAEVTKQFKAYGLVLDRPYLNSRTVDCYDPAPIEASKTSA